MRITRLEIFGFKSFVERFVLNFDRPLIGIVGPNGCGKSNIVDALRWVLGETHAKQLRGATLEDVIFNGSETRRPLGMAEVSITIKPDSAWSENELPTEVTLEEILGSNAAIAAAEERENGEAGEDSTPIRPVDLSSLGQCVPGIFQAAEIQITRRLYRSGESEYFINRVPCRLRDLSDLYRVIGLGPRGLSIVQQGQISEIVTRKPVERRQLLEEAAGISGFRVRMEAATRQLERTTLNVSRLNDIIQEVEKQLVVLRRQAKRAKSRESLKIHQRETDLQLFETRSVALLIERQAAEQRKDQLTSELTFLANELLVKSSSETEHRAQLDLNEEELSQLRRGKDRLVSQVQQATEQRNQVKLALAEVDGQLRSIAERLRSIDERKQVIASELERRRSAILNAAEQQAAVREQKLTLEATLDSPQPQSGELAQLTDNLFQLRSELTSKRRELNDTLLSHAALQSEVSSLEKQLQAMTDFLAPEERSAGVDDKNTAQEVAAALAKQGARAMVSGLRVPEELSRPVAAVLGERLRSFVCDEPEAVFKDLRHLIVGKQIQLGVVRSYWAGGSAQQTAPRIEVDEQIKSLAPSARSLLECIEVMPGFSALADLFLGQVLILDTAEEAFRLINASASELTLPGPVICVTKEGEVVSAAGWYTTANKGTILGFPRLIEEKSRQAASLVERSHQLEQLVASLDSELVDVERRKLEQEASENRRMHGELNRITGELASLDGLVNFEGARVAELSDEELLLASRRQALLSNENQLNQSREQHSAAAEQEGSLDSTETAAGIQGFDLKISQLELSCSQARLALSQSAQESDTLRRRRDSLNSELVQATIACDRHSMELNMLQDDTRSRYGEEVHFPSEDAWTAIIERFSSSLEQRIQELQLESDNVRRKIEREGDVDPESIELCEKEELRLAEMIKQSHDLTRATHTLERTIATLKEVSRQRFVETFKFVNEKFAELIPRLFGGGSGHLELLNPDDPLNSGVEVTVRPPGKKLRSLELLSGGEKALSAAALLVSMFLYKTSPLCVLDEVDAPLDDANLERFLDLIKDISRSTQFLLITHNKQSMAAMNRLLGITMQERGVSTALSVSLTEAEEHVELPIAANM